MSYQRYAAVSLEPSTQLSPYSGLPAETADCSGEASSYCKNGYVLSAVCSGLCGALHTAKSIQRFASRNRLLYSGKDSSLSAEIADCSGIVSSFPAETADCSGKAFWSAETTELTAVPLTDRYYRWSLVREGLWLASCEWWGKHVKNHLLTPSHCQLSHKPRLRFKPRKWWETKWAVSGNLVYSLNFIISVTMLDKRPAKMAANYCSMGRNICYNNDDSASNLSYMMVHASLKSLIKQFIQNVLLKTFSTR